MESGEPFQLEYRGPSPKKSSWQRVPNRPWGIYYVGLLIGTVPIVAFVIIGDRPLAYLATDHFEFLTIFLVTAFAGLIVVQPARLAYYLIRSRPKCAWPKRLLFPLITMVYFPSLYFVLCEIQAFFSARGLLRIALNGDPIQTFGVWILIGILATAVSWRSQPFGRRRLDWFLAGFAWAGSYLSMGMGMMYLKSTVIGSYPDGTPNLDDYFSVMFVFAIPLIVGLTFDRIDLGPKNS